MKRIILVVVMAIGVIGLAGLSQANMSCNKNPITGEQTCYDYNSGNTYSSQTNRITGSTTWNGTDGSNITCTKNPITGDVNCN